MGDQSAESTALPSGAQVLASVPALARTVLARLTEAGGRAWLVGGAVRDLLLGARPRDFDIATDLPPQHVVALFPPAPGSDLRLGAVRLQGLPAEVVVTTLRREADYADQRHPRLVEFVADPRLDAIRRDFTVNALYLDAAGDLLDPTGGLGDLARRRLRAIGEPGQRFAEDPLRLLRAVRLAARCGLQLEAGTAAAMTACAGCLQALSGERVFAELTTAFTAPGRGLALRMLVSMGLAQVVLPEVAAMAGVPQPPQYHPEGDVLTHTCLVLDHVPDGDAVLAWTAVLHDIGKPPTFRAAADRIRFDGHDAQSATMAEGVLQRFGVASEFRRLVVELCRDHIAIADAPRMRPRRRERLLRKPDFARHLAFHRADCLGSHGDLSVHDALLAELAALPEPRPQPVRGADVLALGVPPGPMVGELLRELAQRLDEEDAMTATRERALDLLRELAQRRIKHETDKVDRSGG